MKEKINEPIKNIEKSDYELTVEQKESFEEVKEHFPEIKSIDDLPECVIENALLSGKSLLDELLRYRLFQKNVVKENQTAQQNAAKSSIGSQQNKAKGENPEAAEFLKGLWRK